MNDTAIFAVLFVLYTREDFDETIADTTLGVILD